VAVIEIQKGAVKRRIEHAAKNSNPGLVVQVSLLWNGCSDSVPLHATTTTTAASGRKVSRGGGVDQEGKSEGVGQGTPGAGAVHPSSLQKQECKTVQSVTGARRETRSK
jgi:hypothetical protein